MALDQIPEDHLRAALRPYRADAAQFEAAVQARLAAAGTRETDQRVTRLSPLIRSAAAYLPLQVLAGCQGAKSAASLVPVPGIYKVVSYLAFPAISLFLLLGATVFSAAKIRAIQNENSPTLTDEDAVRAAIAEWWRRHRWYAWAVNTVTLALMIVGATSFLFVFYLLSFGLLLLVLSSLGRMGLGNRTFVARSCGMALLFLAQASTISGIGSREIHFVDQKLLSVIFLVGALLLLPFFSGGQQMSSHWKSEWARRNETFTRRLAGTFFCLLVLPLMFWSVSSLLWPATSGRLKRFVESFDTAHFQSATWREWAIVAHWTLDANLQPDLSRPRQLLQQEIEGEQDRFILGSATQTGLLNADQIGQLREYDNMRRTLLTSSGSEAHPILSLAQYDWVIRAAALRGELSPEEQKLLERNLLTTLDSVPTDPYAVLETPLRVTQLLDVIGRPIDKERYRAVVHDMLLRFHCRRTWWSLNAGGFRTYSSLAAASPEATADGVELMELYGVPDGLDLSWVRAFLRPKAEAFLSNQWAVEGAARARLNRLPGIKPPSVWEYLYYERSLLAAAMLVVLCCYAAWSSPVQPAATSRVNSGS